jgi:hypothetical protein
LVLLDLTSALFNNIFTERFWTEFFSIISSQALLALPAPYMNAKTNKLKSTIAPTPYHIAYEFKIMLMGCRGVPNVAVVIHIFLDFFSAWILIGKSSISKVAGDSGPSPHDLGLQ